MQELDVQWLNDEIIEKAAWDFLIRRGAESALPVDVELIVEELGFDIVPIPNLQRSIEVEGFCTSDFTRIYVDEGVMINTPVRYRFTLAHELGHFVLHKDIYESIKVTSVADWKKMQMALNETSYQRVEFQGYYFAGFLLVSEKHLDQQFNKYLPKVNSLATQAKAHGIPKINYLEHAVDRMASLLAPVFNVSSDVMVRRIFKSRLNLTERIE